MSVITGETGAGKSIILGALGLTLGDRTDKAVLGTNGEKVEISAAFEIADNPTAKLWLTSHDVNNPGDEGNDCLIRRVINADGSGLTQVTSGTGVKYSDVSWSN